MTYFLSPWRKSDGSNGIEAGHYCRQELGQDSYYVIRRVGGGWEGVSIPYIEGTILSLEEAMRQTDQMLSSRGHIFLTEEQLDKYLVLA